MKKLLMMALMVSMVLIISACGSKIEVTFELEDGEVYDTVTLDEPGRISGQPVPEEDGKHFFGWFESKDYTEEERFNFNTRIKDDMTLHGKFVDNGSETPLTDALTLEPSDYEGKSWDSDGIQEVSLRNCTDGDTARFTSVGSVRYLNIDTPESTGEVQEWGIPASDHMCELLEDADTIVVEAEPDPQVGRTDSTGDRTLGYVWADGRLTNLEMIERGYSKVRSAPLSKYGDYMYLADRNAENLGLRVHGEEDPDFDPTRIDATIEDLNDHPEDYYNRFVNIEGWVETSDEQTLELNENEDFSGESVRIYKAYEKSSNFTVGYKLSIEGLYFKENGELTNLPSADVEALVWE
ncbi:MAG: thermonuclease family protein [Candidatus Izemoplasmataceae bacterium]